MPLEYPLNIDSITPSLEFSSEVETLVKESKRYLDSQSWCEKINDGWLYTNLGQVLCIFLYDVENSQSPEDRFIWVMVGDFPPIYLDTFHVLNTKQVIEVYVDLAIDWVGHVQANQSLSECLPFESPQSAEAVELLKRRVDLLQRKILPEIDVVHLSLDKGGNKNTK